ncbi:MAG TPA: hypothetical protein VFW25_01265 [Silvibacterium sp.]|nr:hypothetical protein [Silvibacterium sp.]
MRNTSGDAVSCNELRNALAGARALTAEESAHVEDCDACLEASLDARVTEALDAKPEVRIPSDFAARVAAQLPEKRGARVDMSRSTHSYERPWGLITSVLFVAVGLIAMAFADPVGMNTRMGAVFIALVVSEIAGIALWLGTGRSGERRRLRRF